MEPAAARVLDIGLAAWCTHLPALKMAQCYDSPLSVCGSLMEIMTPAAQDMHVRLAISALDYSKEGSARVILSKALTATSEVSCSLW